MANKKILFINIVAKPQIGGTAVVIDNLGNNIGKDFILLTASKNFMTNKKFKNYQEFDKKQNYKIIRIPLLRSLDKRFYSFKIMHYLHEFLIALRLCFYVIYFRIVKNIDKICIGEITYNGYITLLTKILFARSVLYIHGEEVTSKPTSFLMRLRRLWFNKADKIISVSRQSKFAMIELFDLDKNKIFTSYNAIDRFFLQHANINQESNISNNFICWGRLSKRKGHIYLLQAFAKFKDYHSDASLRIIGNGECEDALKNYVKEKNINDVYFINSCSLDELISEAKKASTYIQTNIRLDDGDNEGFGLTYIEAAHLGLGVISGNTGGVIEAVEHNYNGLIVDSNNIEEIYTAMNNISKLKKNKNFKNCKNKFQKFLNWHDAGNILRASFNKGNLPKINIQDIEYFDLFTESNVNFLNDKLVNNIKYLKDHSEFENYVKKFDSKNDIIFIDFNLINHLTNDVQYINLSCEIGLIGNQINIPPKIDLYLRHLHIDIFLPKSILEAKLENYINRCYDIFGKYPTAYKSEYGLVNENLLTCLDEKEINYLILEKAQSENYKKNISKLFGKNIYQPLNLEKEGIYRIKNKAINIINI